MKCSKFISIIFCFLNVPFTLGFAFMNVEDPDSLSRGEQQKCYDTFALRTRDITAEIRNNTKLCEDLKFKINQKVELMHDLTKQCALKTKPVEYFACITKTKYDNEKLLDQILLLTENVDNIEKNRTTCLIEAIEKGKYKSSSAQYDLNLCLQENVYQSNYKEGTTLTPPPQSELLSKILNMYENIKNCTQHSYIDICLFEMQATTVEETLTLWFEIPENGTAIFDELTKIDNSENSCLRQFTIMYSGSPYNFDLKKCFTNGFSSMIELEENEDKDFEFINKMKKLHRHFNHCRIITKDLDIQKCIWESKNTTLAGEVREEIPKKSDRYIKKISEIAKNLYTQQFPCMDTLIRFLQFEGFNMGFEKYQVFECLLTGSKPKKISKITKTVILDELNKIQNSIKNCTLHPDSPGFKTCFINIVGLYRENMSYIIEDYENYKEVADESDKINQTCFKGILDNRRSNEVPTQVEKCIMN